MLRHYFYPPTERSIDKGCVFVKGYYELKGSCRLHAEISNIQLLFQKSGHKKSSISTVESWGLFGSWTSCKRLRASIFVASTILHFRATLE